MKYIFIWCFLLSTQVLAIHGSDTLEYSVRHYTNENGLPQNSVKSIAVDDAGFVWLATEAGLVRFDGRDHKLYNRHIIGSSTNRMVSIERNPLDGKIYALSDKWNLLRISGGRAESEPKSFLEVFDLVYPKYNLPSILTNGWWKSKGFAYMDKDNIFQQNLDKHHAVSLDSNGIFTWHRDKKVIGEHREGRRPDTFSIFTSGDDVYVFPKNVAESIKRVSYKSVENVRLTGDILKQKSIKYRMLCGNTATGALYLYTDQCFYEVKITPNGDWKTELILTGFDFNKEQIISGHYDRENETIYLGSAFNGMFVFKRKRFQVRTASATEDLNNVFYEIIPFDHSTVLSGNGALLSSGNTPSKFYPPLKSAIGSSLDNAILKASDGTIWMKNAGKLCQRSADLKTELRSWYMPYTYVLAEGADGIIWIGTNRSGIFRLDPSKENAIPELFFKDKNYLYCMSGENRDFLWVGADGKLIRIDLKTKNFVQIGELDNKTVRSIYAPRPDEVWVCTYQDGFFLYRGGKVVQFPVDRAGHMNTVHRILEDKSGFFWMSTNNGIFKALKGDLLRFADGRASQVFYQHFTKESGFKTNEFNGSNNQVGLVLKNGYFAFSSMNGVVMFRTENVKDELPDKDIIIDDIMIDGRSVKASDTIILDTKPLRITARLSTPYFGNPNNLSYEYSIANVDDTTDWILLEDVDLVFTSLPPGDNFISIRKMAGFGAGNYTHKRLVIRVPFAWYETLWFKVAAFVVLILLIWLSIHFRLRYVKKRVKLLEMQVAQRTEELSEIVSSLEVSEQNLKKQLKYQKDLNQNITHNISTPLRYLTMNTEYFLKKIKNNEVIEEGEMAQFYDGSKRVNDYTDKLVTFMKASLHAENLMLEEVNLRDLVSNVIKLFKNANRIRNNEFINNIEEDKVILVNVRLLELVLHNLIDNAVKNTIDGTITFHVTAKVKLVSFFITDTGKGMEPDKLNELRDFLSNSSREKTYSGGLGIKQIKDILPSILADLEIDSQPNVGTTVRLSLPL